ncbi:MAG: hypothetical protein HY659_14325 [Rhizobiales bacterium]|nr:hypothetical protein [Hyphomicrobiales bacterium]
MRFLGTFDVSGMVKLASLWVLPFAHEDLAIVTGAYIIVHHMMPTSLVVLSIYGGIVASDFALYGLGAGARRLPWLSRFADARVRRFGATLKRNIFGLVALCRFIPGVVFVAFIACGWMRVPFGRFTIASLVVSAAYLPLMLYLATAFGGAADDYLGFLAWPLLLSILFTFEYVRRRILNFDLTAFAATRRQRSAVVTGAWIDHAGLPAMAGAARKVARAEHIPPVLFYVPLVLHWIWLGLRHRCLTLPSAANPAIITGGMWGESKSAYFEALSAGERQAVAEYVVIRRANESSSAVGDLERALRYIADAGLDFPLVAKPDIGWHGYGVRRLAGRADLYAYLDAFPAGSKLILQRLVPHAGEAAILYARMPGEQRGRLLSFALRYFPHVVGDGISTVAELIAADPRARWKSQLHLGRDQSHQGVDPSELVRIPACGEIVRIAMIGNQRAGGLYRDANDRITDAMENRFDTIARSMRDFHYGRFDIRFASLGALLRGEDFSIVEINGIGGEAIDVWDPALTVREAYRRLFEHQRLLFAIGAANRARGFAPDRTADFIGHLVRQTQLIQRYPPSN